MDSDELVLYYSLNQDQDWLAVGTTKGYKIYNLNQGKLVASYDNAAVGIIEMLYSTNLLAIVGADSENSALFSPKRLTIWNSNSSNSIWEISFPYKVTAVKINKQRLVISIKDKIHIYDLKDTRILESIVVKNQLGRIVLSPNNTENWFLVYSDSITSGTVKVYDAWNLRLSKEFEAHEAPILKMAMNYLGNKLVTTSCKGTIIRVFALPSGQKLHSFKRGLANVMVYSLNFSKQGNHVVMSSDSGTLHCFKIPQTSQEIEENNSFENDDDEFSDLSLAKNQDKQFKFWDAGSWVSIQCYNRSNYAYYKIMKIWN